MKTDLHISRLMAKMMSALPIHSLGYCAERLKIGIMSKKNSTRLMRTILNISDDMD